MTPASLTAWRKEMTRKQMEKRRAEIVRILSTMSKAGWQNAILADWKPLETELAAIDAKLEARK